MGSRVARHPLASFFVLANLFSWMTWAPLAAAGLGWTTIHPSPYLHLVGGFGPLVAAMIVTAACDGPAGLARLAEMCVAGRRRLAWSAFAVAAPVLLFVGSVAALNVAGQDHVVWAEPGRASNIRLFAISATVVEAHSFVETPFDGQRGAVGRAPRSPRSLVRPPLNT
jgi:hypothetical protein